MIIARAILLLRRGASDGARNANPNLFCEQFGAGDQGPSSNLAVRVKDRTARILFMNTRILGKFALGVALAGSPGIAQTVWVPSGSIGNSGNSSVGIGTSTPSGLLEISGSVGSQVILANGVMIYQKNSSGVARTLLTKYSDNKVYLDNVDDEIQLRSAGGHIFIGIDGASLIELMRLTPDGKLGIGTGTPSHKLAVNGTIRAKEVIVDTGWSDYVFADEYRLAPLSEVEAHIRDRKHLPGIPSAADVAKHGISVGEMQAKLLEKIEELTLHVIRQQREIRDLQQRLELSTRERLP